VVAAGVFLLAFGVRLVFNGGYDGTIG